MIKNIVFDMGRVLIHWEPQYIVSRYGHSLMDTQLICKELFTSPYWVMMDRGTASAEEIMAGVCPRLPEHLHNTVRQLVTGWWRRPLTPMEGMADLIKELKGMGYGIYLLSNASTDLREYFSRIPGSRYFDGIMVSAEEKLLKPEHEIFEALYARFGLNPGECFFIDDSPANVEASIRTGMNATVFYTDVDRLRADLRAAGVMVKEH